MDWMDWIRTYVQPAGPAEMVHRRAWATVRRVPVVGGTVFFKQCAPVQAFEPALTAGLSRRWPDRVPEVLAHDVDRAWLLLADAGTPIGAIGNPPEAWEATLPRYAELQRGEATYVKDHIGGGVPDLRVETLPSQYEDLLRQRLPLRTEETDSLRLFAPHFAKLCEELATFDVPASIQHDDLHLNNLYDKDGTLRVVDWGDSSIAHPFFSLVVTFRFLEERNGLAPGDPWFRRLRDAYLEPWGSGYAPTFDLAQRVGAFARAFATSRVRRHLPADALPDYDTDFAVVLRRALACI
ncbi:MAG: phosphotransferase [Acidimicrobiia bacterium]|nr:phosphotransferase [Acidimicrobiia bacterium]